MINEGGWREVHPLPDGSWSLYFKYVRGVRHAIVHHDTQICWCLLLNGVQVAKGDIQDMILRSDAVASGVTTVAPGQLLPHKS